MTLFIQNMEKPEISDPELLADPGAVMLALTVWLSRSF